MPQKNLILGAVLALASAGSVAQGVWRCGSSYGQQPCTGGSAVAAPHTPTAAEAAKAEGAAKSDAARAEALEKARLAREKNAPKAIVIAPAEPADKPVADKRGTAPKMGKLEQFTAVAPGTGKPKNRKKEAKKP